MGSRVSVNITGPGNGNLEHDQCAKTGHDEEFTCSLIEPEMLGTIEPSLNNLIASCVQPNPFLAPAFLQPALKRLTQDQPVMLLCIWGRDALIGFLPVTYARGFAKTPFKYLASWAHPYCFIGAPLVRKNYEAAFVQAVHECLPSLPKAPAFLYMDKVPLQSGFLNCEAGDQAYKFISSSCEAMRPAVLEGFDFQAHVKTAISSKRRNDLARLSRRLGEVGSVQYSFLESEGDLDVWIDAFLHLEDQGWKGSAGTSMYSNDHDALFFRQMIKNMMNAGGLLFQKMQVDDKIIAMSVNFLSGSYGYGFKSCFDEAFAKFSPGVLASLNLLEHLGSMEGLVLFDSCASPDQSMLNRYWPGKCAMTNVVIGANCLEGRVAMSMSHYLEVFSELKRR